MHTQGATGWGAFSMRRRVGSIVGLLTQGLLIQGLLTQGLLTLGLLTFGSASAAEAAMPDAPAAHLIRIGIPSLVGGLTIGAAGAWILGRRGIGPLRARADEAVAALDDAQSRLERQAKLAMLGQLSGSVGHELRNPLGVMTNAVYYLEMVQPGAPDDVREYHGILRTQLALAERIVTDLLDFSRVRAPQTEVVSAARLVDDQLSRLPLSPDVRVVRDFLEPGPRVRVDPVQIGQVLFNLLLNAVQAMDGGGGTLTVRSRRAGDTVCLDVADTGPGVPAGFEEKVFEALFTTKARGIGLGLAVSRSLAETNGGRLTLASRPGAGATFTLTLPGADVETGR
jgi:signal transduction histidine kinase